MLQLFDSLNGMRNFNNYIGLFADHYEFTMAQGYLLDGREECPACFDYFFRKNPFNSGFTVFAGLFDLLEMVQQFKFNQESIDHLSKAGFHSDFLDYLKDFSFKGNPIIHEKTAKITTALPVLLAAFETEL